MNKLINFFWNYYSWIIWCIATLILSFFIVHNAQWLIGDDAIIIKKTGSGIPFSIYDTINPESGRFFPLAYYAYNILLLFNKTVVSVQQHYILVSIAFFVFSFLIFKLSKEIVLRYNKSKLFGDVLALLFTFMIIQRAYSTFSHIFSTIWVDYLLLMVFIYNVYLFLKTQKNIFAVVSFISILYCVFCIETIFIIPASLGTLLLLVGLKNKSKNVFVFGLSLVLLALSYLLLYYFVVYRFTINAYDGSHGADKSLLQNAIDMLLNQKLIIVSLVILLIRMYMVIVKKDKFDSLFDTLLLTGLALTLGSFVLGLNWGMYYMITVIFVGFPILYFTIKYVNIKYSLIIIGMLSIFYIRNYPKNIQTVQKNRIETKDLITTLKKYKDKNYTFMWRDELLVDDEWDRIMSQWKKESLTTLLKYEFNQNNFIFENEDDKANNLNFYPDEYRKVTWNDDLIILSEKAGIIITIKN